MSFKTITVLCGMLACVAGMEVESVYSQTLTPALTPVRRTTIVTADPEESLRFYRDVLGFEVEYDQVVTDSGTLALLAPGASEGRAIALRYGPTLGGSIGLFWTPGLPAQKPCVSPAEPGSTSILLLTDDLDAVKARLNTAGFEAPVAPASYNQSRGPTDVYMVFDPNCVRVSIAEIANETLEESLQK